jgi:glycosyltransferase involved in cell wall biosynthesis
MRLAVLIPVFNAEATIGDIIEGVKKFVKDIVVVNDGSRDRTQEILEKKDIVLLTHPENQGKGMALKTGFRYIIKQGFEAVLTLDGDGQHNIEEIPSFIKKAESSPEIDIIIGSRMKEAHLMPKIRLINNKFSSWLLSKLTHQKIEDSQSGFRLIRTHVLKNIALRTNNYETESELLIRAAWCGYQIVSIPIKTIYQGERSYFRPIVDSYRFLKLALGSWFTLRKMKISGKEPELKGESICPEER